MQRDVTKVKKGGGKEWLGICKQDLDQKWNDNFSITLDESVLKFKTKTITKENFEKI